MSDAPEPEETEEPEGHVDVGAADDAFAWVLLVFFFLFGLPLLLFWAVKWWQYLWSRI